MNDKMILGLDIGGSHITAGMVNLTQGFINNETVVRDRLDALACAETIVNQMKDIILPFVRQDEFQHAIALAFPGPFDYENSIPLLKDQGKFRSIYKMDLSALLAEALQIDAKSIRFFNDAASFLQGEIFCGVGKECSRAIGLTLGTGLGSSKYFGKYAEDAALWKAPFMDGIGEDYLSTKWFTTCYKNKTGKEVLGVKELAELGSTEPIVQDIFNEFGKNLALFLAEFVHKDQPELIILGGSMTKAIHFFYPVLSTELSRLKISVPVKISVLGELSALIGAASLFSSINVK
ncbi:ROK family protein [Anditalea andensis]|uniref:ROK family transcriptional regulator n=1 Tax=Anditalea andensis TaxID=1048983 RepID=A0A074L001_9BACT|nr:ROK family protein [Anditalea andensis]KEO75561.1 hypothetical protein EL17_00260 [Anditalea andensis]